MNLYEINPYVRKAIPCILKHNINMRIIFDYELVYLEEGRLQFSYNGNLFQFRKGDLFLICPGIPHSFTCITNRVSVPHIHFDLSYDHLSSRRYISFKNLPDLTPDEQHLIQSDSFPAFSKNPLLSISDPSAFLDVFYAVINNNFHQDLTVKMKMLDLIKIIITDHKLDNFKAEPPCLDIASQIKTYIDANYEVNFQLSDLEKQFCYSKFYLDRLFKQKVGISIIQYRCQLRLNKAPDLLLKYSVSQTSQMLGFSSVQTFSRAFRTQYQKSPTEYIRKRLGHSGT